MRTVADAMITLLVTVEPGASIQDASAAMLDAGFQVAVVVDHGKVCGIVTADSVARALAEGYDATETPVDAIAERDPPMARPDEPLAEAHQRLRALERGVAPVAGSHGELLGVLVDPEAGS